MLKTNSMQTLMYENVRIENADKDQVNIPLWIELVFFFNDKLIQLHTWIIHSSWYI
jgi:hypothetical protein